jgi:hypothetical protein
VNVDNRGKLVSVVATSTVHARVGVPLNCAVSSAPGGPNPLVHDQFVEVEKLVLVPPDQVHVRAAACPAAPMAITPTLTASRHRVIASDHGRTASKRLRWICSKQPPASLPPEAHVTFRDNPRQS